MTNDKEGLFSRKEQLRDGWVIGIELAEHDKAYRYGVLAASYDFAALRQRVMMPFV